MGIRVLRYWLQQSFALSECKLSFTVAFAVLPFIHLFDNKSFNGCIIQWPCDFLLRIKMYIIDRYWQCKMQKSSHLFCSLSCCRRKRNFHCRHHRSATFKQNISVMKNWKHIIRKPVRSIDVLNDVLYEIATDKEFALLFVSVPRSIPHCQAR